MNEETIVSASKEQTSCSLENDTVILNMRNSTYYELNPVAARIWELIQSPIAIADLRQAIVNEYDVDEERAGQDIARMLGELDSHQLLVLHGGSHADGTAPAS